MFETLVESGHRHRSPNRAGAMALAVHVVAVVFAVQHSSGDAAETLRPLPIPVIFEDPARPTPTTPATASVDGPGIPVPPAVPPITPGPVVIAPIILDSAPALRPGGDLRRSIVEDARRASLSFGPRGGSSADGALHLAGEVDVPVQVLASVTPRYPRALEAAGVPGRVVLQFVVDTAGGVEPRSVQIVEASDSAFAESSREALRTTRFAPARARGQVVRQLVRQTMVFRVSP